MRLRALQTRPARLGAIGLGALLLPLAGQALAEGPIPRSMAQSVIEDQALSNVQGVVSVNMAAGDGNLQANAGAIAVGPDATARATVEQSPAVPTLDKGEVRARIGDGAFAGAQGWIAVNQSAGQANAQNNTLVISTGIEGETVDNADLGAVGSSGRTRPGEADDDEGSATASIDPTAFAGARGVVQVNQAAGSGNATSNRFELHVDSAIGP